MGLAEQPLQGIGETRTEYEKAPTKGDEPYKIPADAGAKDEVFSGPRIDNDNVSVSGYRISPDMPMKGWKETSEFHPAGEKAGYIHFGALTSPSLNEVLPDAIGLGEAEETPFSAQRGEMPEGTAGKFINRAETDGFVEARKPVKSDVPANR